MLTRAVRISIANDIVNQLWWNLILNDEKPGLANFDRGYLSKILVMIIMGLKMDYWA